MSFLVAVFAFVSIACLGLAAYLYTRPTEGSQQLALWTRAAGGQPRFERYVRPLLEKWAPRFESLKDLADTPAIERKLELAGYPYDLDPRLFFSLQILGGAAGLFLGLYWTVLGLCGGAVTLLIFPAVGFWAPRWWLNQKANERQYQISLEVPDMLDLLSVCVQAGMGMDQALQQIARKMEGPLSEELKRFMRELIMGAQRREALRGLSARNESEELDAFVKALLQSEELGVPIAQILRLQAQDTRAHRSQKAKELAGKTSPRISLVAVGCITPSAVFLIVAMLILSVFLGQGVSFVP